MYEFACGSPVCNTHLSAPTRDELLGDVLKHVEKKHKIAKPTKSLVEFLVANTVTQK
jgi:predicted small metal-binding protein